MRPRCLNCAAQPLAVLAASEYEAALARRCIRPQGQQTTRLGALWHGAVSGHPIILLRCGMGPVRAEQAAIWLADSYPLRGLISIGFAGGLQPDLHTGDVVLAQRIQSYSAPSGNLPAAFTDPITPTPRLLQVAAQAAFPPTSTVYRGALLSARAVVAAAAQKQRLGQLSKALAVDMEAHSIGRVAVQRQLPFVSLKTVFDAYDDDIALSLTQCTTPTGSLKLASLVSTLLFHPALLADLPRLRRKAKIATQHLESWLFRFLTLISHES